MKKITIIPENPEQYVYVNVVIGEKIVPYPVPCGVEVTVSDEVYAAAIVQYNCRVGYFVNDADDIDDLPTTGIADGSYAFIISTQKIRFLSEGSWQ